MSNEGQTRKEIQASVLLYLIHCRESGYDIDAGTFNLWGFIIEAFIVRGFCPYTGICINTKESCFNIK